MRTATDQEYSTAPHQWIPIAESEPVYPCNFGYWNDIGNWIHGDIKFERSTHWIPMPEPPPQHEETAAERAWNKIAFTSDGSRYDTNKRLLFVAGYVAAVEVAKVAHARYHVHFTGPCQCALCGLVKDIER